jgi:two-component system, NtrC family, sensor histidine kinase PilS
MNNDGLPRRLQTLLLLRSLVIAALSVVTLALRWDDPRARTGLVTVGVVAVLTIVVGVVWLRWRQRLLGLATMQLLADGCFAAALVALTGGVESVFIFVLSLSVLTGAATLERRGAIFAAVTCTLLYAVVMVLQTKGVLRPFGASGTWRLLLPTFTTNVGALGLVAVLGTFLAGRLAAAQDEIVRLEDLTSKVLQSLPSGVVTLNGAGKVIYANASARELLHAPQTNVTTLELPAALADRTHGTRFETDVQIEGRNHIVGGSVASLVGGEGRVLVFQDLTTLRKLEADVVRSRKLAELGRMSAGLAHEIRNPLAAMLGCLELLRTDAKASSTSEDDEKSRMLDIIHREATRLSGLVTDFLTYSRPAPPRIAELDVMVVVREVLSGMRSPIEVAVTGPPVALAYADGDQLKQVLWNLLRNAEQATTATIQVHVRAIDDVEIHVDDDGPGLSQEQEERLFEPFYTTRSNGTGLGLATSYQLTRQVGGDLRVGRSPIGGARFSVTLKKQAPAIGASTSLPPAAVR